MRRRALAVAVTAWVLVACTASDDGVGPTSTTRPTPSTSVVDLSGVALPVVAGETTSTVRETGTARLVGTVTGPDGPVAGATVRIERLVAGREVRTDVTTASDGRFALDGVPGGRYRVRAFLPPDLAQTAPELRFVADGGEHAFDLVVEAHGGVRVLADVAPDPPVVGGAVNLVVQVRDWQVDADGIVRAAGVPGVAVQLTGLGRWVVPIEARPTSSTTEATSLLPTSSSTTSTSTTTPAASTRRAITDADGQARFELRCVQAGDAGLALAVPVRAARPDPDRGPDATVVETAERSFSLDLPACVAEAPTTTTSTTAASGTEG